MSRPTLPRPFRARGFAWPRLLLWIGVGVGTLLLVAALVLAWLLGTTSGARFALARATGATAGKLTVARVEGRLAGPLQVSGLRWRDPAAGIDARIDSASIDLALSRLLARRVLIHAVAIDGVEVALTTVPPKPEEPATDSGPVSLAAPIDIVLENLALTQARVSKDGEPVFALDRLDLAGAWTRAGIDLRKLDLSAPEGHASASGTIGADAGFPGARKLDFRWKAGETTVAGEASIHGDGKATTLALTLAEPMPAKLDFDLAQGEGLPWTLQLAVPRFDTATVLGGEAPHAAALDLRGSGTLGEGRLEAELGLDGRHLRIAPLQYTLREQVLDISSLHIESPEVPGQIELQATAQLADEPPGATLAASWTGVELPAELAGRELHSEGSLGASGSAQAFQAEGKLRIGPPGQLADLAFKLAGSPEAIQLERLALEQPRGGLSATGEVKLQPQLGWDLTARAERLDPGAFAAAWPGAIDFALASRGRMTDQGPDATLRLDQLGGTLRQRPLAGSADLALRPGYLVDGTLDLGAGSSRLHVVGKGGGETDARIELKIAALGEWLADAAGALDGQFHLRGTWPALAIEGSADAQGLVLGETRIDSAKLRVDGRAPDAPRGTLRLDVTGLASGGAEFTQLALEAKGDEADHRLELDAAGSPLGLRLALAGHANQGRWSGSLETLDLRGHQMPPLALERPAALAFDGQRFEIGETCLRSGEPGLCIAARGATDGAVDASYRIEELPLAFLARLANPELPLAIEGKLGGQGEIHRHADGALDGNATLGMPSGQLATAAEPAQALLAWEGFHVEARLAPAKIEVELGATLDHGGRLAGDLRLEGPFGAPQVLASQVDLELPSLAFIELLTDQVANAEGRLAAHWRLAGTTAAPEIAATLELAGFAIEVPAAGLKLHDGKLRLHTDSGEQFALEGALQSGEGQIEITGNGGLAAEAPIEIGIRGKDFLAADIPAVRLLVTPDLAIRRDRERLDLRGSITIPAADIDLARLPGGGGGGAAASRDVVVVDDERPPEEAPLPIAVAVDLILGDAVKLAGMGLDGRVEGQLHIDQRPGRQPTGTGTLNASGTYKAYGQDLEIEAGRVLFAGTAIENPGLDIRAVRKIRGSNRNFGEDAITAGLQVRGTAQLPVLTVFSRPAMAQSEALSYLITGKPLSALKSGEGDMLGSAAQALGSAGGDLLAKSIGSRLGVDAGVSDSAALGGAAFTVGKYLSPKLYLSYGVGLFSPGTVVTLKYLFSPRWNFEAENATTGSRAGINYRHER